MNALVTDNGQPWGDLATDWQRADALAILEPQGDPAEPSLHWLERPKGGSKTTDAGAMTCAWLVEQAPPLSEGYALGADLDASNRLLQRVRGFVARTAGLASVLRVVAKRIVNVQTGAMVHALEADVAGSEGLLSPWVVVDEVVNWADTPTARAMWTSAVSGIEKWPGMRFVVISHAGSPGHWSRRALDSAIETGWRVVSIPGPLEWLSSKGLERQRGLLMPSEFARRHLNIWTSGEDKLTTAADVRACTRQGELVLPPVAGQRGVVALDVGLVNDRTVATVAHIEQRDDRTFVVVDRQESWQGSPANPVSLELVEAWVGEAARAYNSTIVIDPWQAAMLAQRLRRHQHLKVIEFTFGAQSVGRLCITLFRLLRDHLIEIPDDEALADELLSVKVRETSPGVHRIDHDSGKHDDRVISLALAAFNLIEQGPSRRGGVRFRGGDDMDEYIVKLGPKPVPEPVRTGAGVRFRG